MMRKSLIAAVLFVVASSLSAQTSGSVTAASEIRALELKFADLIVHEGWDEYASHLAEDYLMTEENGALEKKTDALATLRDTSRKIIVMEAEPSSEVIRIYGDTAIASEEFTVSARAAGQVKSHRRRQTDIFLKRDGQWLLVNAHATTIGK